MNQRFLLFGMLFLTVLILIWNSPLFAVKRISAHYKKHQDFVSLEKLTGRLKLGMPRKEVEGLLGEPTYCPAAHTCYYASDRADEGDSVISLAVDYILHSSIDGPGKVTGKLESFFLGPIAE